MSNDPQDKSSLAGLDIVVTRPAGHAEGLIAQLQMLGARVYWHPTIEIRPLTRPTMDVGGILAQARIAVFVSPNAVVHGLASVDPQALAGLRVAAVGPTTAGALRERGFADCLTPATRHDSEGLLQLPVFEPERIAGANVVIVRGRGGRELLADALRARGAEVRYLEVYERCLPAAGKALDQQLSGRPADLVVTSGEGLDNLFKLQPKSSHRWLRCQGFTVVSERQKRLVREQGVTGPITVARGARDAQIVSALLEARRARFATISDERSSGPAGRPDAP